ncbi:MAG: hypothetical protein AAF740_05210, partial [Bacteroidota bacterium]
SISEEVSETTTEKAIEAITGQKVGLENTNGKSSAELTLTFDGKTIIKDKLSDQNVVQCVGGGVIVKAEVPEKKMSFGCMLSGNDLFKAGRPITVTQNSFTAKGSKTNTYSNFMFGRNAETVEIFSLYEGTVTVSELSAEKLKITFEGKGLKSKGDKAFFDMNMASAYPEKTAKALRPISGTFICERPAYSFVTVKKEEVFQ